MKNLMKLDMKQTKKMETENTEWLSRQSPCFEAKRVAQLAKSLLCKQGNLHWIPCMVVKASHRTHICTQGQVEFLKLIGQPT